MSKKRTIPTCHPDRITHAHGLCLPCYRQTDKHKELQRKGSKKHYLANKERVLERCRQWNAQNKARKYAVQEKWRRNNVGRVLWAVVRQRAKHKGLEFSLAREDIKIPELCPVLGIPIVPFAGKFAPNSPSVDRIDNSKGYTKENIVVVSFRANNIKNNATVGELKKIYEFYSSLENKGT
jgi:hypothetical protein